MDLAWQHQKQEGFYDVLASLSQCMTTMHCLLATAIRVHRRACTVIYQKCS